MNKRILVDDEQSDIMSVKFWFSQVMYISRNVWNTKTIFIVFQHHHKKRKTQFIQHDSRTSIEYISSKQRNILRTFSWRNRWTISKTDIFNWSSWIRHFNVLKWITIFKTALFSWFHWILKLNFYQRWTTIKIIRFKWLKSVGEVNQL